jgi:DNA-binding transcriptional ArsR family regulator
MKDVKGRVLFPRISDSRRVSRLGARGALVYTWLLPHCDDQGRILGDAHHLKETLAPHLDDLIPEDIEWALEQMTTMELVIRYVGEDQPLLQVTDWWRWQGSLRYKYPSENPPPPEWIDRVTALVEDEEAPWKWVFAKRIVDNESVICPICEDETKPYMASKGSSFCFQCSAELLSTKSPKPRRGKQYRTTNNLTAGERIQDELASRGPLTIKDLSHRLSLSPRTITVATGELKARGIIKSHERRSRREPVVYEYVKLIPPR